MRWSVLFIPTLRECPVEVAAVSRQLLMRAGYLRQLGPGADAWLFLGQRSLARVSAMVRAEMDAMGAQQIRLPLPANAVTSLARGDLRSYKQLPQLWYQPGIHHESWSFHIDSADLDAARATHRAAFSRILQRCGIPSALECLPAEHGPDSMVLCPACGYAAHLDTASARPKDAAVSDPEGDRSPEAFPTPGRKTIAEISEFTGSPESAQIKSLVLIANGEMLLVLLRGDHQLSPAKFADAAGDPAFRPANGAEIRDRFGAGAGSLGPVGVTRLRILADDALRGRRNMIAGANRDDYHLRYVTPEEDFQAEFMDLRQVAAGDPCSQCGAPLEIRNALQISYLRRLTTPGLHLSNATGVEVPLLIGSYGIRTDRLLAAAVERHHDKDGIILPPAIAPFTVIVTPVNFGDTLQRQAALDIYQTCLGLGLDALLDDRDERPGVKFKDADLIGVPFRITVGKKAAAGIVELVRRRGHQILETPVAEAAPAIARYLKEDDAA
jgi:prolyl-tRNA synthetase